MFSKWLVKFYRIAIWIFYKGENSSTAFHRRWFLRKFNSVLFKVPASRIDIGNFNCQMTPSISSGVIFHLIPVVSNFEIRAVILICVTDKSICESAFWISLLPQDPHPQNSDIKVKTFLEILYPNHSVI